MILNVYLVFWGPFEFGGPVRSHGLHGAKYGPEGLRAAPPVRSVVTPTSPLPPARACAPVTSEQVLWWAISRLNNEVEEREEKREEVGCKFTPSFDAL